MAGKKKAKPDQAVTGEVVPAEPIGPGRPTKIDHPDLVTNLVRAIHAGAYVETAAVYAGINKSTFYEWLKRGAQEEEGPYRDFSNAIKKAMAMAELRDLDTITKAAAGGKDELGNFRQPNWTAAAWRLERRFPDKWGWRKRTKEDETPQEPTTNELATMTDAELHEIVYGPEEKDPEE